MEENKKACSLEDFDPELVDLAKKEEERQRTTINLIASENYASSLSTSLEGSVFANKNTEGYPNRRFVGGCEYADKVESLAIERLKKLFGCEHANVQAMSATIANVCVMNALLKPGEVILSMNLNHGGHLSHGAPFHYSGKTFKAVHYGVDEKTETIDMNQAKDLAIRHRPKMIICGTSSYPRLIDFPAFADIAKSVGALLFVDLAHNVGLVAAGTIPSPVPYADVVTTSTHKTWRGPRGAGVILCRKEHASKIDRAVFPGIQGASKLDMIAARAVLFKESMTKEFKAYARQVLVNAKALAEGLKEEGIRLVSGGTDTHLILADICKVISSGKEAESLLESVGIITNKNMIPFDPLPPNLTSGLRIGSPFLTTRGVKASEMRIIGRLVGQVLKNQNNKSVLDKIRGQILDLAKKYPLFADEWMPEITPRTN